jgi:hypothetical protein
VISFIAKTWFLWWMFAIVIVLRWFHLLVSANAKMESPNALASEEEQEAYIVSWRVLHKTQVISLFETERAN